MKKLALGIGLLTMTLFLVGCFKNPLEEWTDRPQVEKEVEALFSAYGFTGEVVLDDYSSENFLGSVYRADVTYKERVAGKDLSFSLSVGYGEEAEDTSPSALASSEQLVSVFYEILDKAMWEQPQGQSIQEAVEATFVQHKEKELHFRGFSGSVDTDSPVIDDLYALIEKNRKEGKSLQGLYHIPIKDMMEKEIVTGYFGFHLKSSHEGGETLWEQEEVVKDNLIKFVREADFSKFPDGKYEVGFHVTDRSGTISGGVANTFRFYVKDGQLSKLEEEVQF